MAGFSISLIIDWLVRELFWLRLWGGLLLIAIGVIYWFKRPAPLKASGGESSPGSDIATTFFLTLTNPTTVLSFLAVLAGLRLGEHRHFTMTLFVVGGIFAGAMVWWTVLVLLSGHFRDRFNDRAVLWMNRIAAFAIGGFGVITMALAFRKIAKLGDFCAGLLLGLFLLPRQAVLVLLFKSARRGGFRGARSGRRFRLCTGCFRDLAGGRLLGFSGIFQGVFVLLLLVGHKSSESHQHDDGQCARMIH